MIEKKSVLLGFVWGLGFGVLISTYMSMTTISGYAAEQCHPYALESYKATGEYVCASQ